MADLVVPKLGESISEAVIAKWLKQVGEAVALDENVVELETDKVSVQVPAPVAGRLAEQKAQVGDTVNIGDVIATIAAGEAAAATPAAKAPADGTVAVAVPAAAAAPATRAPTAAELPAVPRVVAPSEGQATPAPRDQAPPAAASAGEHATIPHSRTLPPSVRKAIREGAVEAAPVAAAATAIARAPSPGAPAPSAPVRAPGAREEVVAMTPLRKRIAQRLVEAQHTAAILTTFNEVDMTAIQTLRARYQDAFVAKHGIKVGFMSFFVRACVESLKLFPGLNAEVRGDSIVYKRHYDFGIAVGGGKGLVVPVVRDVDALSMAGIEKEIARLAQRAKDNQLTLDELQGGTFSISNGGIYGSMMSTPLLNMPQTGILGMHNIIKRPIAVAGDKIELRPMMYLALSYDHRVVDGREAVQFLVGVKERLEAPERMLLEV